MWEYSLDLQRPDERRYVPSHEFFGPVGVGDQFDYEGRFYEVLGVTVKQSSPEPGEPARTLLCRLA